MFNVKDGGLPMITLILCLMVMVVGGIGFMFMVSQFDTRVATTSNDSVNLTGISYNTETFNMTNQTVHVIAKDVIPNYAYVILIFIILLICTIMIAAFNKH